MAKRKKTDFVQFKVRFREALRARLETRAGYEKRSLNSEIVQRLEDSFKIEEYGQVLEILLAQGAGMDLLKRIAMVLRIAGPDWYQGPNGKVVAGAINKIVAVYIGEEPLTVLVGKEVPHTANGLAAIALSMKFTEGWGPFKETES